LLHADVSAASLGTRTAWALRRALRSVLGVFAPEAAAPYLQRKCNHLTVSWAGDAVGRVTGMVC